MHAKTAPTTSLPSVFTDEHEIFRETCRRFYREELEPNYLRWEQEGNGTPREFWRKAGEVGLVGMAIPEEYGGPGGDFLYNVIQNEEMGRFVGGASVGAAIATDLMTYVLIEHGTDAQKRRWCPWHRRGRGDPGHGPDRAGQRQRREQHPGACASAG
jgi:long-chain-acyl-CoA dehydrogenase